MDLKSRSLVSPSVHGSGWVVEKGYRTHDAQALDDHAAPATAHEGNGRGAGGGNERRQGCERRGRNWRGLRAQAYRWKR